jgi:ribonuclease HI
VIRGECEKQVKGFRGALHKSFTSQSQALIWLEGEPKKNDPQNNQKSVDYIPQIELIQDENLDLYTPVWTDGSALGNSRTSTSSVAGIGVFFGDNDPKNRSLRLPGIIQTNQRAEIYVMYLKRVN